MTAQSEELISVIMPAYRAEKTVEQAIRSALSQSWQNLELIIVDDGSDDGTVEVIRRLAADEPRIRFFENEGNLGVSRTRVRAAEESRGKWLAFLDSDDVWMPDKLERQMALQRECGAELIYTASSFISDEGEAKKWVLNVPERMTYRRLLKQNRISNSSVLISRSAYFENVVIGENMHEDYACWLRYLRAGKDARGIDEPLLIYRLTRTSKSANKWRAFYMNFKTYRRVGVPLFPALYYQLCYTVRGLLKYLHLV